MNPHYLKLLTHHLEDSAFCAYHLASLLPLKSSKVRWKSCFAGYPCAIIADDLLVWGKGTADHDVNLKVLKRAQEVGKKLSPKKCKYPVTLSVDASKSGLGAACLQDGVPVAYTSTSLRGGNSICASQEGTAFCPMSMQKNSMISSTVSNFQLYFI